MLLCDKGIAIRSLAFLAPFGFLLKFSSGNSAIHGLSINIFKWTLCELKFWYWTANRIRQTNWNGSLCRCWGYWVLRQFLCRVTQHEGAFATDYFDF